MLLQVQEEEEKRREKMNELDTKFVVVKNAHLFLISFLSSFIYF